MTRVRVLVLFLLAVLRSSAWTGSPPTRCVALEAKKRKGKGSFGGKRGRLQEALEYDPVRAKASTPASKPVAWTRISGVSLPDEGKMKPWELALGADRPSVLVGAKQGGKLYVFDNACTKCAWDLYRGKLRAGEVECPLCETRFVLETGEMRPAEKGDGFKGFVGNLARNANLDNRGPLRVYPARVEKGTVEIDMAGRPPGK